MPKIKKVTAKIGNMRKPQEFVVYKDQGDGIIRIQSDTVYARICAENGVTQFANRPGGAYAHSLIAHGSTIKLDMALVAEFKAAEAKEGEEIGPGVFVG